MTEDQFNEKYKEHLEEGHYGLAINNINVIEYLDKEFESIVRMNPDFKYSQIKTKFSNVCFYSNLDHRISSRIERHCRALLEPYKLTSILTLVKEEMDLNIIVEDFKTVIVTINERELTEEQKIDIFGKNITFTDLQADVTSIEATKIVINLLEYKK